MNLIEFEAFSKEFFEVLVNIEDEESTKEVLKLIGTWICSHRSLRKIIEDQLIHLSELADIEEAEMTNDMWFESGEDEQGE